MRPDMLLVRYGELALKKRNRRMFEERLLHNIRQKLDPFSGVTVQQTFGRMFVHLNGADAASITQALQQVFGIVSVSPVVRTELDIGEVKGAALALMEKHDMPNVTFKVETQRANKQFPLTSQEVNREVGALRPPQYSTPQSRRTRTGLPVNR